MSVDSTATDVSVDETWDPSFQESPMHGNPATSTPHKEELKNTLPEQESPDEMVEVTRGQVTGQSAQEEDQTTETVEDRSEVEAQSETPGGKNARIEEEVDTDRDMPGSESNENAAISVVGKGIVLADVGQRVENHEPQKPRSEAIKTEAHPLPAGAEDNQQLNQHTPDTAPQSQQVRTIV